MNYDIRTLAVCLSLVLVAQAIAIFVQYKVNQSYRGIGWWLLGTIAMALGSSFMPLVNIRSLLILAMIANPLVVLGNIFIYIGIIRFLGIDENKWRLIIAYVIFFALYFYFIFASNNISARTAVVSATTTVIILMTAYKLYVKKDKTIATSGNFTAAVFLLYGIFTSYHFIFVISMPTMYSYNDHREMLVISFIMPIIFNTLWAYGFIIMVNQRLNAENREEKDKMQMVFDTSPDAALITRLADGLYLDANEAFSEMSGYSRADLIGSSAVDMQIWRDMQDRVGFVQELELNGYIENREYIFQRRNKHQFIGVISARIISINEQPHVVSVVRDISEKKLAEAALLESEEMHRSILDASPDDITITDMQGHILLVSPAANRMFSSTEEDSLGRNLLEFIVPEDRQRAKANILLMHQGHDTGTNEYRAVRQDGSIFDIEVNSGFIRGANGQPIKMLFIVRDITERKQTELKIQQLMYELEIEKNTAQLNSITDSLTGLANRRYFDDVLRMEFFRMQRNGSPLSLIMLDVDHFKKFNDCYGHLAGDDCLRQIGAVLKRIVSRAPDIVVRYGGEEFMVILPETGLEGARLLAERIRLAVEALEIPHTASETARMITVSLGVATVNPVEIASPEDVVLLADTALYSAKQGGRNQTVIA